MFCYIFRQSRDDMACRCLLEFRVANIQEIAEISYTTSTTTSSKFLDMYIFTRETSKVKSNIMLDK